MNRKGLTGAAKFSAIAASFLAIFLVLVFFVIPAFADLGTVAWVTPSASNVNISGTYTLNVSVVNTDEVRNVTFWYTNASGTYNIGNVSNTSYQSTFFTYSWNVATAGVIEGAAYYLTANATNGTGDINNASLANIRIDRTVPTVTITTPTNGGYVKVDSNGRMWVNGTVYDNLGMGTGNVTINNTNWNNSASYGPYSFTGGNNTAYAFYNNTGVSDGTVNLKVNYTDSSGLVGNGTVYFTVDNTNPILNNTYPANNSYLNSASVVFNVSLTEQNIDYTKNVTLYYRKSGQASWQTQLFNCWGNAPSFACNGSAINLADWPIFLSDTQVLQFFYNTTDSVGLTATNGTSANPLIFTLDTTNPTSTASITHTEDAPAGYDNDTTITLNWTAATDGTSGIKQYRIYVSKNAGAYVYNSTNNSATGFDYNAASDSDGTPFLFNVTSVDNAGNENTTGTVSPSIILDTSQPTSPSNVYFEADPTNYYDNDTTITLNWTAATDTYSGISSYKIYVWDNEGAGGYVYNGTNNTALGYSFTGTNGRNYSVNVTAVNGAGIENTTGSTSNTTIYVDTTEPASPTNVVFTADPTTSYDNDGTVVITWTAATDATSGIKQYRIYIWENENSSGYVYWGTNTSATAYQFTGEDGKNYSANVTAVDNVNNINTTGKTSSTTIKVDTTNPASPTNVVFTEDPTTSYDNDVTVDITWTAATDTNGILNYKIYIWENQNASGYVYWGTNTSATGYQFTGTNGRNYSANVTANDSAHNENTTGTLSSTTIKVDTTSPASIVTVSPTLANNSYTSNDWVYVNVTFTEINPDKCILEWNNGTVYNITASPTNSNCYWNLTSQPAGSWNYSIYVNDSAGNEGKNTTFVPFYVNIDLTNPVINETLPTGYVNDPTAVLFKVKLTEQNRDNSVNVTVYFKPSYAGAYASQTLICYDSAPTWICNKTIDSGLLNGETLQFFFNTTDLASRTGENGNQGSPLTATVDTGAPRYSNVGTNDTDNVIGKYDGISLNANWTNGVSLDKAILETNETGSAYNWTGGTYGSPYDINLTVGETWSNFSWSNSSLAVGTVVQWKIYANDSAGNQNVTAAATFTIDGTAPTYANNGTSVANGTIIAKGTSINVYANWSDNVGLSSWEILNNTPVSGTLSGTFASGTTNNWTNVTIGTSGVAVGTTIQLNITVNDTSGNRNYTSPTWVWTIDGTAPKWQDNSTSVASGSTYASGVNYGFSVNFTDDVAMSAVLFNSSYSGSWATYNCSQSGDIFYYNLTDRPAGTWLWNFIGNDTSGNVNTTDTWTYTIAKNSTNPIDLYLNGTANTNLTVVYPAQVNATYLHTYGSSAGTPKMYRISGGTETDVTSDSGNNVKLGNNTYEFKANVTGNTNYTDNTTGITLKAIVEKGTILISLELNQTNDNKTYTYPSVVNATGNISAVDSESTFNLTLYRDSVIKDSTTNTNDLVVVEEIELAAKAAGYNYTLVFFSTNYTNISISADRFAIVNKGATNISLWLNGGEANKTIVAGVNANFTATLNASYNVAANLFNLTTDITGWGVNKTTTTNRIENITATASITPAVYNITAYFVGTENYTADSQTWYLTIQADTTGPVVLIFDDGLNAYGFNNATARKAGLALAFNLSVSDAGIGVGSGTFCNVTINGSVAGNGSYSGGWCNITAIVPDLSNGAVLINITANDTNGNIGFNDTYYLTYDETNPTITITSPSSGTWVKANASGYMRVIGNISDNLQMGTSNPQINSTFAVDSFAGTNNTQYVFRNSSTINDVYIALRINYTDNATNTGENSIGFYVDNTPPITVTGDTTGTKTKSSAQEVNVTVNDGILGMTNAIITLNYIRMGSWATTTMTGTPSTSTTYTATIDTSMLGNENVYYYVNGTDNATNSISTVGNNATYPLAYFTIEDTTAPNQPTNLVATQIGSTKGVSITWIASTSTDVTGYYVYRATGVVTTASTNLGEAGNTTQFTDIVPADGTWNYTVVAHDAVPNVNTTITASALVTVTTTDSTAPINPATVTATQVGSTRQVNVSWTASASSDAVRYNIYYGTGAVTTSSNSFGVGNVTQASITVPSDGNWNFTVTAIDSSNNENKTIAVANSVIVTTADTTAPNNPATVTVAQVGSIVNVNWTASTSTDVAGYNVYYERNAASTPPVTTSSNSNRVGNVTNTSIPVTDGEYNFTVTAVDSSNNENKTIVTSAAISIDITAPSIIAVNSPVGAVTTNTVILNVSASEPASCRYNESDIYYGYMSATLTQGAGYTHTVTLTGLINEQVYNYYIRCSDVAGNVMASSTHITFTPYTGTVMMVVNGPSGTTTDNTPLLNVSTNQAATCKYSASTNDYSSMSAFDSTAGTTHLHNISTLTDNYYTYRVSCRETSSGKLRESSVFFRLDTRTLYNITRPNTFGDYWTANTWNEFNLFTTLLSSGTTNYTYQSLFSSIDGKYTIIYRFNETSNTWGSYRPGASGNDFTSLSSVDERHWIYVNATDRLEIEPK